MSAEIRSDRRKELASWSSAHSTSALASPLESPTQSQLQTAQPPPPQAPFKNTKKSFVDFSDGYLFVYNAAPPSSTNCPHERDSSTYPCRPYSSVGLAIQLITVSPRTCLSCCFYSFYILRNTFFCVTIPYELSKTE